MPLSARPAGVSLGGTFAIQTGKASTAKVWWPSPTLMATEVSGYLDASAARFLAESIRVHLAPSVRVVSFHDWENVSDYASEARIILTSVGLESIGRSDGIHVLAHAPLVRFGLRAANVILRKVHAYGARAPFDVAMNGALRKLGG